MAGLAPSRLATFTPNAAKSAGCPARAASAAPAPPSRPAAPLPAPLEAASYRHPQATREVLLGGQCVAYALRRSQRRSIGFSVDAEGLAVSAPKSVTLAEIDQALQRKALWILRKLHETRARQQRQDAARVDWRDGAVLPFRGELLRLVLDPTARGASLRRDAPPGPACLHLPLAPDGATSAQIERAAQAWLQLQARQVFTERLDHFAPQLGVAWTQLTLSSAATRWGSARADGAIRLNWRLLHLAPALLDYVVVHELSHLRVMDHSARFWAVVASVMPDHAALRRQLKAHGAARW